MEGCKPDSLSTVDAFDAVASEPRQAVLDVLLSANGASFDVGSLARIVAEDLATAENAATPAELAGRVELMLVHHHLPRLDDEGLVEFDEEAHTVEAGDHIDDVEPLI
jgi:DNA-binding transcriptional ArsR family regulator